MRRRTTLVFRVPGLAQERSLHHGENYGYAALLLVNLQGRDNLREGVQFEGGHLRFQFRFTKDRLIDLFLALARGDGLGDRQPALVHLVLDRGGFLLRLVHGRLDVFLLVLTELERFGQTVEPRASAEAHTGYATAAAARATTTAAALGKHQRRRQKSGQQNPTQHLLPPLASTLAASAAARSSARHAAAGEHSGHQIKRLRRFGLLVGLEQRI